MKPKDIKALLEEIQARIDRVEEDLSYQGEDWDRLLSSALNAKDALEEIKNLLGHDLIKELMREYKKEYKDFS